MKISDSIENFILDALGEDNSCEICRNELAVYFHCAPSQINYCLMTRFTAERGFRVESQRGGGGYIRIERLDCNGNAYLNDILKTLNESLSYIRAKQIISYMFENKIINDDTKNLLLSIMSDKALSNPMNIQDTIRQNIMKEIIIEIIRKR